jgi:glycerol uptake facilitator-like aquaporin
MLPANFASRAGSTPEASGDWSSGTFEKYMKTTPYIIIRVIGAIGAIWIVYLLLNAQFQIHQQTKDIVSVQPGLSIGLKYFLTATLPFGFLATLLVLPYTKMKKWMTFVCIFLMVVLAGAFFTHLFGPYFLSARFSVAAIPSGMLLSAATILGFFLLQIVTILLQNRNRTMRSR